MVIVIGVVIRPSSFAPTGPGFNLLESRKRYRSGRCSVLWIPPITNASVNAPEMLIEILPSRETDAGAAIGIAMRTHARSFGATVPTMNFPLLPKKRNRNTKYNQQHSDPRKILKEDEY